MAANDERRRKLCYLCGIVVLYLLLIAFPVDFGLYPMLEDLSRKPYSHYLGNVKYINGTHGITALPTLSHEESEDEDLEEVLHLMNELKEAKKLYEEVRILCWVLTYPKAHNASARVLKETWGRRCNKLVFMSTKDDPSLGAIDVGSREGYLYLLDKSRRSIRYIYNNFLYDFDWFLKADDNTYVLMENLRYMLRAYSTDDPLYFGAHYKVFRGYNTGGAGYVLGREAVRRFVERAMPNKTICAAKGRIGEDVAVGNCLQRVGIKAGDTRDEMGKGRFWQVHPSEMLHYPWRELRKSYYPFQKPPATSPSDISSDTVVSFHEMKTTDFYLLEYLIYKVRVFGHIPTLPLRVPLPPDLSVVPERTLDEYRKKKETWSTPFSFTASASSPDDLFSSDTLKMDV